MAIFEMNGNGGGGSGSAEITSIQANADITSSSSSSPTVISPTLLPDSLSGIEYSQMVILSGNRNSGTRYSTVNTPLRAKAMVMMINELIITYNVATGVCQRIASDSDVTTSTLFSNITVTDNSITFSTEGFSSDQKYGLIVLC